MQNKTGWNALFGLIGVDKSPDKNMEVKRRKICGSSQVEDTFNKQIAARVVIPDDWLPFSKESA